MSWSANAGRSTADGKNIIDGKRAIATPLRTAISNVEGREPSRLIAVIALVVTGGLLDGCVIEPIGYDWHHPYYHDRY